MTEKQTLIEALSAARSEFPKILKKTAGYGYNYAELPDIHDELYPVLRAHGIEPDETISYSSEIGGHIVRFGVVLIATGERKECDVLAAPTENKSLSNMQNLGASITYARRHAMSVCLGIAAEKDIDGTDKEVKKTKQKQPERTGDDKRKAAEQAYQNICSQLDGLVKWDDITKVQEKNAKLIERLQNYPDIFKKLEAAFEAARANVDELPPVVAP